MYYGNLISYFIIGLCLVIIAQESVQITAGFMDYIQDKWNWIDMTSTVCAGTGPVFYLFGEYLFDPDSEYDTAMKLRITTYAQVIGGMFLWVKFLYYFRTSKKFGYLVRMIEEVFADILPFLFAFSIVIVAFSDAFYSDSNKRKKEDRYIPDFFTALTNTYQIALGEF